MNGAAASGARALNRSSSMIISQTPMPMEEEAEFSDLVPIFKPLGAAGSTRGRFVS